MPAARPVTEEEAATLALSLLREDGIADLAADSHAARTARQWFGLAREQALRAKDYNFAAAWVIPAAEAAEALGPLKTRYRLPGDCLKVRSVDGLGADAWAVENEQPAAEALAPPAEPGMMLVTNATAPLVHYTRNVTDVRLWDAQFCLAFARQLAAFMAGAFGKSSADIAALEDRAADATDDAAMTDAREKAPTALSRNTSWIRERTSW